MDLWQMWDSVLFQVRGESITVGSVVLAVILIAGGFLASRLVSRLIAGLFGRRMGLDIGARNAIESLGFYILFATTVVASLNLVNFPLTVFTIAGGALAIGVGFGSQNVMGNFISGLILHLERPIRSGDLIELQGTYGIVERIGARSTRIRASDNTHIVVPNSFFVENNLVNFTLSDDVVRTQVDVGVIYGSPTREVERLIRQAIQEHPRILKDHEPRILFTEFGDNALLFQALFWLRARTILERREVESELRFRIDDLFREAGLVIAFPQRDVHLDTARPLEVRLLRDAGPTDGDA